MYHHHQQIIDEVNRIVDAAGSNPATVGDVTVTTEVREVENRRGYMEALATVRFYVTLTTEREGRELHLSDYDLTRVDSYGMRAVQMTVDELWQPGAVDAAVARVVG